MPINAARLVLRAKSFSVGSLTRFSLIGLQPDANRWDEFYMAPSPAPQRWMKTGSIAVCCAETCGPEVFDLTGA